jgi:hypothetical protein
MKALAIWSPAPFLKVTAVEREASRWFVTGVSRGARLLSGLWRAIAFASYPVARGPLRLHRQRCEQKSWSVRRHQLGPMVRHIN